METETQMTVDWSWWQQALENPKEIGESHLPISVDSPESGFYRARYKGKQWEPVAIWQDDGNQWIALRSGKPVDARSVWNWCCRYPISAEAYDRALDGGGWADDDPTVAAALAGHNVGGLSERELIADEIESAKQGAEAYTTIVDDDQVGKAQSLRARMNELSGKADKAREALKRPHLEAGKQVDAEWQPLVKDAKGVADMLKRAIEKFETQKLAKQRQQEQERREDAGGGVAAPAPTIDTTIKGSYGRAASVGIRRVVAGLTDHDAVIKHYWNDNRLWEAVLGMAQKDIDRGLTVPGVAIAEEAKIS
jgi:hypothetical protein